MITLVVVAWPEHCPNCIDWILLRRMRRRFAPPQVLKVHAVQGWRTMVLTSWSMLVPQFFFLLERGEECGGDRRRKQCLWNGTMSHRPTAFRNRLSPPVGTLPRFRHSADRQTRHGHCVPPEPPLVQLDFFAFWGALPIPVTMIRPARTLQFKFCFGVRSWIDLRDASLQRNRRSASCCRAVSHVGGGCTGRAHGAQLW